METVLRVALAYALLLVAFRVLGKRELRKMSPFELVMLLFIPQLFSRALTRQDYSFTNALIASSTLLTLVWLTSAASYRVSSIERIVEGEPTVLIANGELMPDAMDRERVSAKELFGELHRVGLTQPTQVQWAILEASGTITVVPRPGTLSHLGNVHSDEGAQGV